MTMYYNSNAGFYNNYNPYINTILQNRKSYGPIEQGNTQQVGGAPQRRPWTSMLGGMFSGGGFGNSGGGGMSASSGGGDYSGQAAGSGGMFQGASQGAQSGSAGGPWGAVGGAVGGMLASYLNRNAKAGAPPPPSSGGLGMTKGLNPALLYGLYGNQLRPDFQSMLGQYLR